MEERRRFILFAVVPVVNSYGVGGPRSLFHPLDAFGRFVWCIGDVFLYYLYDFKHVMVIFHLSCLLGVYKCFVYLRHCSPWLHFLAVVAIGNFIAVLAEIVMIVARYPHLRFVLSPLMSLLRSIFFFCASYLRELESTMYHLFILPA